MAGATAYAARTPAATVTVTDLCMAKDDHKPANFPWLTGDVQASISDQTTLPNGLGCQPQRVASASTTARPRPASSSQPREGATGSCAQAKSWTSIRRQPGACVR